MSVCLYTSAFIWHSKNFLFLLLDDMSRLSLKLDIKIMYMLPPMLTLPNNEIKM